MPDQAGLSRWFRRVIRHYAALRANLRYASLRSRVIRPSGDLSADSDTLYITPRRGMALPKLSPPLAWPLAGI